MPSETTEQIEPVEVTRAATSTSDTNDMMGVKTPTNRAGERQRQAGSRRQRELAAAEVERKSLEDARVASELGRDIDRAIRAKPNRAGERQRQAESKRKRQEAADIEEAAKRRRQICEAQAATTPAQRIMARMKERVAAREGMQKHADDKG